ncbi:hypothetical protein G7046_g2678 [Stylonectria norvegica]|nr:hypothetical protein G7046_g2678 [Stylonectria norvegica]
MFTHHLAIESSQEAEDTVWKSPSFCLVYLHPSTASYPPLPHHDIFAMCFLANNVFGCGCEKAKEGAELQLCEFAKIKTIACNGTMIAAHPSMSTEIPGPCMECLAKEREAAKSDGTWDHLKAKFRR